MYFIKYSIVKLFKKFFKEDNSAGDGGSFGGFESGGAFSGDFYAPGSAIIPSVLGTYSRKGKVKGKKRRAKSRKGKVKSKKSRK